MRITRTGEQRPHLGHVRGYTASEERSGGLNPGGMAPRPALNHSVLRHPQRSRDNYHPVGKHQGPVLGHHAHT